ncbi:MAG: cupin domain-containing protein [Deltaproteobacteria bacterium]|nr:cupin domain-containing protein [Deltaproteobacteria bacterium]
MAKHKHLIHLSEVPVDRINAPEGSVFGGSRRRVGAHIGAQKLGYSFFSVPPGKTAFPYHNHMGNEEMIYIIDGDGVLRLGKEELAVSADTVIACPPGDFPHQLINTGCGELRYLVVSTMAYPDISAYPDSNKIGAYATSAGRPKTGFRSLYVRDRNVNYYDGEEGEQVERILKSARRGTKDTPAT